MGAGMATGVRQEVRKDPDNFLRNITNPGGNISFEPWCKVFIDFQFVSNTISFLSIQHLCSGAKKKYCCCFEDSLECQISWQTQQTNPWDYAPNVKTHGNIKDFSRPIVHCSPSMYQWICCLCQYLPLKSPQIPPATFRKDRSVVEDLSSVSFFGRKCQGASAAFSPCRFTTLEGLWLYPQNTRNPYMQIMPKEVHNLNEFHFKDSRPFWKDSSKLNHFTTPIFRFRRKNPGVPFPNGGPLSWKPKNHGQNPWPQR